MKQILVSFFVVLVMALIASCGQSNGKLRKNETKIETFNTLETNKFLFGKIESPVEVNKSKHVELNQNGLVVRFQKKHDRFIIERFFEVDPHAFYKVKVRYTILEGDMRQQESYGDIVAYSVTESHEKTGKKNYSILKFENNPELGQHYELAGTFSMQDIPGVVSSKFAHPNSAKYVRFSTNPVRGAKGVKVLISEFSVKKIV